MKVEGATCIRRSRGSHGSANAGWLGRRCGMGRLTSLNGGMGMFRTGSTSLLSSNGEAAACLFVASGCVLIGLPAAMVNAYRPGSTVLSAFLWIGAFYAILGLLRARVRPVGDPPRIVPACGSVGSAAAACDSARSGSKTPSSVA